MTQHAADVLCVKRATSAATKLRAFATLSYGARSWHKERRIAARIEATSKGLDIRYVVTSLKGTAKYLYESVYCARGRPRTSSSGIRRSSPPTEPRAAILAPTSSG